VRRLRRKVGLPEDTVVYGLRHHFGTQAILNNVELKTLSQLMGHEDTRITEKHYVHLEGQLDHLADAMRRANGLRPGG
jgi:integrase